MKIAALRRDRGLTQAHLAQLCETTQQQIAKIENGTVDPRLSTMRRLAEALNCDLPDIFWTKVNFVEAINSSVAQNKINLKTATLIELNIICSKEKGIPGFHPFWEHVRIDRSRLQVALK